MNTFHPSEFEERRESVPPFELHIASYRINGKYYCSVDDVDPGAVIARSEGTTREEAEFNAVKRAKERMEYSRVRLKKRALQEQKKPYDLENEN